MPTKFEEMTRVKEPDTSPRGLLGEEVRAEIRKRPVKWLEGVCGDNKNAYEKAIIQTDHGLQTELYGCPFLYPGVIDQEIIDKVAITKGALWETINLFTKFPFVLVLPFCLIFRRKSIEALLFWFEKIYRKDLIKLQPPMREFSDFPRALIEAWILTADEIKGDWWTGKGEKSEGMFADPYATEGNSLRDLSVRIAFAGGMFIQFDNAYRQRPQDVLSELNRKALDENPKKEILRVVDLLIQREHPANEFLGYKWKVVRFLVKTILFATGDKGFLVRFFQNIDLDKVQLTEADKYFRLRRVSYNYGGIPYPERLKMAEQIEKDKGIIFLRDA